MSAEALVDEGFVGEGELLEDLDRAEPQILGRIVGGRGEVEEHARAAVAAVLALALRRVELVPEELAVLEESYERAQVDGEGLGDLVASEQLAAGQQEIQALLQRGRVDFRQLRHCLGSYALRSDPGASMRFSVTPCFSQIGSFSSRAFLTRSLAEMPCESAMLFSLRIVRSSRRTLRGFLAVIVLTQHNVAQCSAL